MQRSTSFCKNETTSRIPTPSRPPTGPRPNNGAPERPTSLLRRSASFRLPSSRSLLSSPNEKEVWGIGSGSWGKRQQMRRQQGLDNTKSPISPRTPISPRNIGSLSSVDKFGYTVNTSYEDQDDLCSERSYDSTMSVDRASSRRYAVHCSSDFSHTGATYLTPTQRTALLNKDLKAQLRKAMDDIVTRDHEISRLTQECVELRMNHVREMRSISPAPLKHAVVPINYISNQETIKFIGSREILPNDYVQNQSDIPKNLPNVNDMKYIQSENIMQPKLTNEYVQNQSDIVTNVPNDEMEHAKISSILPKSSDLPMELFQNRCDKSGKELTCAQSETSILLLGKKSKIESDIPENEIKYAQSEKLLGKMPSNQTNITQKLYDQNTSNIVSNENDMNQSENNKMPLKNELPIEYAHSKMPTSDNHMPKSTKVNDSIQIEHISNNLCISNNDFDLTEIKIESLRLQPLNKHDISTQTLAPTPEVLNLEEQLSATKEALIETKNERMSSQALLLNSGEALLLYQRALLKVELSRVKSTLGTSHSDVTLQFLKSAFFHLVTDSGSPAATKSHWKAIQSILGFDTDECKAMDNAILNGTFPGNSW